MSERKKPVTKKSRIVQEISSVIVNLVIDGEVYDPSKTQIVNAVVSDNLGDSTSTTAKLFLETEYSNALENYFSEICEMASAELDLPFHYTSKFWYKGGIVKIKDEDNKVIDERILRAKTMPTSSVEASRFVVIFGNGRTGKAAGVRFVTKEDEPDPMLLIAMEKKIDVINSAFYTHRERIKKIISSEAIGLNDANRFKNLLEHPERPSLAVTNSN